MSPLIRATQLLLVLTLAFGFYTTWYLIYHNGTVELMKEVRDVGPHILPATEGMAALKKTYIGFGWIDYLLTVLTLFFWEAVDGSSPSASLFCFMFAGQLTAAWTILYVEGRRYANRRRLVSFVMCWGLAMQWGAFAVFMPLYLIIHLSTSPTVSASNKRGYVVDVSNVLSIPVSLMIGYALPAGLLALPAPSVLTHDRKQMFIAVWLVFPISVEVLQQIFSFILARTRAQTFSSSVNSRQSAKQIMPTSRLVYLFVLAIAGVTRITTVMLSMTSKLFPALFAPEYRGILDPANVFQPPSFFASTEMTSIGAGAFQLLLYDEMIGGVALIIWSIALYLNTYLRGNNFDSWTAVKICSSFVFSTALFGPCGCALCFMWARDELIFNEDDDHARKSR